MSHNTLENFYKVMFMMKRKHGYTVQEVEQIYPFERDIYVDLILEEINK